MVDEDDNGLLGGKDIPPWLQPVPDDEPQLSFWQARRTVIISASVAIILLGVFVAALVVLYKGGDNEAPRHIAAPSQPVKEKPAEAGGMQVDYQDKKVFDQIDGDKGTSDSVSIAEPAEEPVDIPDEPVTDVVSDVIADMKQSAPQADTKPEPKPEPVVAQKKPEPKPAAPAPVTEKAFRVQLGAYGTEKSAETAWKTIKGKYASELAGKTPAFEGVKSGDRTLYRLRVGPFDTRAAADEVCLSLRSSGQACIAVNP